MAAKGRPHRGCSKLSKGQTGFEREINKDSGVTAVIARMQISANTLALGARGGQGAKASRGRLGNREGWGPQTPDRNEVLGLPRGGRSFPAGSEARRPQQARRREGDSSRTRQQGCALTRRAARLPRMVWGGWALERWVLRRVMRTDLNTLPQPTSRNTGN